MKFVPIVVGTKSINVAAWNKGMKDLRVPEGQRDKARQQCMQILLDAHDLIIRSYWAQKHGEEDGLAAAVGQQTRVHHRWDAFVMTPSNRRLLRAAICASVWSLGLFCPLAFTAALATVIQLPNCCRHALFCHRVFISASG